MKKIVSIFLVLSLVACSKKATITSGGNPGTGEGFGGTQKFTEKLVNLRDNVVRPTIAYLRQLQSPTGFCDFSTRCPNANNPLCTAAPILVPDQKNHCASFLFRNLEYLEGQLSNPKVELEAVDYPLVVNGAEVEAMTSLNSEGKIYFNVDFMKDMTDSQVVAAMVHEYFHKISDIYFGFVVDTTYYPDQNPTPILGSTLNTSAGLEVAFQADALALIPTNPPKDPSSLSALPSTTNVTLTWLASGTAETFQVAYAAGNSAPADCSTGTIVPHATIGSASSYQVAGLNDETTYSFRVCAQKDGRLSAGLTITTTTLEIVLQPPPNPGALQATPTSNSIRLTWEPGTGGTPTQMFHIAYYEGGNAPPACTGFGEIIWGATIGLATSYNITGLKSNTTYSFRVCAFASELYSSGALINATTSAVQASPPPNATMLPSNPAVTSIRLNWTSGGGTTESFQIAYKAGTSAPSACTGNVGTIVPENTVGNVTTYEITGLAASTTYSFRICAQGSGLFASGVATTVTTLAAPRASLAVTSCLRDGAFHPQVDIPCMSGSTLDFGTLGSLGITKALLTITNNGNAGASGILYTVTHGGGDLAPFFTSPSESTCGSTIGIGASCTLVVKLNRPGPGTFTEFLNIPYNDGVSQANKTYTLIGRTPGQ